MAPAVGFGEVPSNSTDPLNRIPACSAIDVVLREERSTVTLEVSDEGPGIPDELRSRVFESYYRIPGSTGSGSGLGLAIVKEVALAHGARVEIGEGPGGTGTRVVVRFRPA